MKVLPASQILKTHDLRVTSTRKEILQLFMDAGKNALSNQDVEQKLVDIDRVTLYRILKSFEESGIIHEALDGSGKTKYALCHQDCSSEQHLDQHAHFHCKACESTTCIDIELPKIKIKPSFHLESSQLILSGLCDECYQKG